jgi:hypothetical protein
MTTSKKNGKKAGKSSSKIYSREHLDRALIGVLDIFERASCPFFLLGETARSIVEDGALDGSEIEIGIKAQHATKEALSALNTVLSDLELLIANNWEIQDKGWGTGHFIETRNTAKKLRFMSEDVPVTVKIIRKKYSFLEYLDNVVYAFDDYKVPNPFDKYYKVRGIIK